MIKFLGRYLFQANIVNVLGVVTGVIIARSLGADQRGILALITTTPQLFSRLSTLGYEQRILAVADKYLENDYFIAASFNFLLLMIPFALILSYLNFSIILISIVIISILIINYLRIKMAFLNRNTLIKQITVINITQAFIYFIFVLVFANFRNTNIFFTGWLIALLAAVLIFPFKFNFKNGLKKDIISSINSKTVLEKPAWLIEILFLFSYELISMKLIYSSEILGQYVVAKSLSLIYYQVFSALLIFKISKSQKIKLKEILLIFIMGIVAVFVTHYIIVPVFGAEYENSKKWLPICFFCAFLIGMFQFTLINSSKIYQYVSLALVAISTMVMLFSKPNPMYFILIIYMIPVLLTILFGFLNTKYSQKFKKVS